jgi:hypothetical protein
VSLSQQRFDAEALDFPPRLPVHEDVRPEQRRQRSACVQSHVVRIRWERRRIHEEPVFIHGRRVTQKTGGGGAIVRKRDGYATRVGDRHARELTAGEWQRAVTECFVDRAAARRVVKHTSSIVRGDEGRRFCRRIGQELQGHQNGRGNRSQTARRKGCREYSQPIGLHGNRPVGGAAHAAIPATICCVKRKDAYVAAHDVSSGHRTNSDFG